MMERLRIEAVPGAEVVVVVTEEAPRWLSLIMRSEFMEEGEHEIGADLTREQAIALRDEVDRWLNESVAEAAAP